MRLIIGIFLFNFFFGYNRMWGLYDSLITYKKTKNGQIWKFEYKLFKQKGEKPLKWA